MANNFNLYGEGIKNGWDVVDAALLEDDRTLEADVAIIGTGAGGGTVTLREDNSAQLHCPISDLLWSTFRHAWLRMAELQFAAGAEAVRAVHMDAPYWRSWQEAEKGIRDLPLEALRARLFTAHQMGGCAMGEDPSRSVVNSWGEHHHLSNLSVHDASIFPTSLDANPQLTVYALAARNSHRLAGRLQSNA